MIVLTRRSVLAAGAALPFARVPAFAAAGSGTLRFGLSSYPPSLHPWVHTGTAAITVKVLLFRGLVGYATDGSLRPELAESWTSEGGKAWVFKLRDAVFQNGQPVTALDVKWTCEQIAADSSTAYLKNDFKNIERIETPDAKTVRLVMKQPSVTFPQIAASPHAGIVAKGTITEGNIGVGAGPFIMKAQERGVSLELAAFDKYYKPGLPKVASIKMIAYADENLRVAALQAGDIDMAEYVPWQSMKVVESDPKLYMDTANGPFMCLMFNGETGPFKDPLLRQAVGFAIRREEIVEAAFFGRGAPLQGMPIDPASEYYNPKTAKHWGYDPDRAKALMAKAGVAKGFSCTLLSTAQYGMHKSTAEVVQAHLSEIGIDVKLNLPDWATRVDLGGKGKYDFCVQGTSADNNDPDGMSGILDGELPANVSRSYGLRTPRIHELFVAGRAEFSPEKRRAIYAELEQLALEQAPLVGLAWRLQGYGMSKKVSGFKSRPGALNFYSGLGLEDIQIA